MTEIKEFFVTYNKLRNRKFDCKREVGPDKARKLIDAGMKRFQKKNRKT